MTPRTLMRVSEVATYIGQSIAWTRAAMADGTIPGARKVKSRWMVPKSSVDAWLDMGQPMAPPEDPALRYEPIPRLMTTTVDRKTGSVA